MFNSLNLLISSGVSNISVTIMDINPEILAQGIMSIKINLDRQIKKGNITESKKEIAIKNIYQTTDLEKLKSSDIVIEAASENFNLKSKIFKDLDKIYPNSEIECEINSNQ